jgi:hypothetical protein
MREKNSKHQESLTLLEAVKQTSPNSTSYAFAAIDDNDQDISYAFNGSGELLVEMVTALKRHIINDSTKH